MTGIFFYAPMKAPDDPVPSGDRRIARLLWRALQIGGYTPILASRLRAHNGAGDAERQRQIREQAELECQRLAAVYRETGAPRPSAWLTYHVYYKAPDWLGPRMSRDLGIPYLIVEPSFAPKRAEGLWREGHRSTAKAISAADWLFCLNRLDMACVRPLVKSTARLRYLSPFIEAADRKPGLDRNDLAARWRLDADRHWLLAVGMFRHGDKLTSYRRLAEAVRQLPGQDWQLLVVGDGPALSDVAAAFSGNTAVHLLGQCDAPTIDALMAAAALYVWPAAGEAFGMAFLEAARQGLPAVAGHERGVPDIVLDGVTGLLVPPDRPVAFANAVRRLLDAPAERRRFGIAARKSIARHHSLETAAARLTGAIATVSREHPIR